ncbi:hypothetical protein FZEAL_8445 [Fusarium zealandicum]|uniref:Rhodopsin domain-containing protein n=1 Tax=Fusarium zealandicum TaxID=1053134 RepID=A0A8H4UES7_9HYPO|nr:hypothetical protein FZEAL_8445 [Fusarium zealandicum]
MSIVNGVPVVLEPPEDYVVDFDNPQRQGVPEAYYVAGFGMAMSFLFIAQRMYVKIFLTGGVQIDDDLGHCNNSTMPSQDVYLAAFIYIVCGSLSKVALLIFYLRLSPQRWFKTAVWSTGVFIVGYTVGIFFSCIFACNPIAMSWDVSITDGVCINRPSLYIATAVANILSDIMLFVLPIPMVVKLQIPRRQKIGLMFIFGIGSLTLVTSVVRVAILPAMVTNPDASWVIAWASVWIIVEANLIITCATMPTLRKFFKHVAPKLIGESRYGSKTGKSGKSGDNSKPPTRNLVPDSQSRRHRHQYSQFDPEEGQDGFALGPVKGRADLTTITGGNSEDHIGWGDSDSEKGIVDGTNKPAIVQRKTVTVEYTHDSAVMERGE